MGHFDDQISGFSNAGRQLLIHLAPLIHQEPEAIRGFQRAMDHLTAGAWLVDLAEVARLANRAGLVCQMISTGFLEMDDDVFQRLDEAGKRLQTMLRAPLVENDHGAAAWLNRLMESKASPKALAELRNEARVRLGRTNVFHLNGFDIGPRLEGADLYYVVLDPVRHMLEGRSPLDLLNEVLAFGRVAALKTKDEGGLMASRLSVELLVASTAEREALLRGLEAETEIIRLLGPEEIELGPDVVSDEGPPGLPLNAPPPKLPPSNRFKKKEAAEDDDTIAEKDEPDAGGQPRQADKTVSAPPEEAAAPPAEPAEDKPAAPLESRDLSEAEESEDTEAEDNEFLTFRLNQGDFGLPTVRVREIITVPPITRLPRSAAHVLGVINLRGMIVPVVDLRLLLGLKAKPFDKYTVIIVVERQGRLTGLVADNVAEVLSLPSGQIQPPPSFTAGNSARFVNALAKPESRLVTLLDLDRLLDAKEIGPPAAR